VRSGTLAIMRSGAEPRSRRFAIPALGLRGQPHGRIGRAVAVVAAAPLDDLEREAVVDQLGIRMQEFAAVLVAVVQQMVSAQRVDQRVEAARGARRDRRSSWAESAGTARRRPRTRRSS
jgi:hypothetical protein